MLTGPQDHSVHRVLVHGQQAGRSSHANAFSRMVDDLSDRLRREMEAKQGAGVSGSKTLATGPAVQEISAVVLTILAANGNVALTAQTVISALFVWAETVLMLAHGLPPADIG